MPHAPDDRTFAAVLPAFNAGRHLQAVLAAIKRHLDPARILVVDDGSSDDTAAVARAEGVALIEHATNRGKGAALATGMAWARRQGHEAFFTLDADGQHDPEEIPRFLEAYRREGVDLVIGTRMRDPRGMPGLRLWTNRITSRILSVRVGARIEDSQSGYRLIRSGLLDPKDLVTSHYETESEILIRAGLGGARFAAVPIRSIYGDEASSIRPLRDTLRFTRLILRSLFWKA